MMHVALQGVQGIVNGKEILLTDTGTCFGQCAVGLVMLVLHIGSY